MVQRPRGTRDFTPVEMKRRLALENLLEKCSRSFGYSRVQTPIFESLDLFTAKSGPSVVGQLYAFKDKSDRDLTLRPELTAPVMRMVADEMRVVTKPLRLSYFGPCFRYEESKKGRYREFFQYGAESIGIKGPLAEAEIVALALEMLHASGLENWQLRIGHVGILHEILTGLGLSDQGEPESEVQVAMRLLDKGDWQGLEKVIPAQNISSLQDLAKLDGGSEILSAAEEILGDLGIEGNSLGELSEMLAALSDLATAPPSLKVDLTVARGLDYYTGMVFEIQVDSLGGEGQILGGGSYRLLHLFGLADLDPCCGFGLGFDRVLLALEAQAAARNSEEIVPGENSGNPLAVIPFKIPASEVLSLVKSLRATGQEVVVELKSRALGKSLAWADAVGASHALIVGPKNLESGTCNVKDLQSGQQVECALDAEAIIASL